MADSWKTSRTRQAQQAENASARAPVEGPWDADGNLRLPAWLEGAPPMPALWPVEHFWMTVGRAMLAGE